MPQTNKEEMAAILDKPALPRMESVERFSKLPVVEQTVDLASNFYGKVKDSNSLVNSVLTTAETTVRGAVDKTLPVTVRFEGQIKKVDSILCSSLDYVENKIPAVKLQPDEIVKNTKDYVYTLPGVKCACQIGEQGVIRVVECACVVSQYGSQKLHDLRDCIGGAALDKDQDPKSFLGVSLLNVKRVVSLLTTWSGVSVYLGILFQSELSANENNKQNAINERKDTAYIPNGTNTGYGLGLVDEDHNQH